MTFFEILFKKCFFLVFWGLVLKQNKHVYFKKLIVLKQAPITMHQLEKIDGGLKCDSQLKHNDIHLM